MEGVIARQTLEKRADQPARCPSLSAELHGVDQFNFHLRNQKMGHVPFFECSIRCSHGVSPLLKKLNLERAKHYVKVVWVPSTPI